MSDQQVLNFIDGAYTKGSLGRSFENISPVDGRVINVVYEAGADEVDAAVTAAGRALKGPWAGLTIAPRSVGLK